MISQGGYKRGELTVHHDPGRASARLAGAARCRASGGARSDDGCAACRPHANWCVRPSVTGAVVIVSIFVNPLQFGAGEDLDAYPRTLDADLELLRAEGVELVFAPQRQDDVPERAAHHHPSRARWVANSKAAARPTHFAGMLTVVAKLLQIAAPNRAYFGEKDYQQLTLIRQMVRDLNFDVEIIGVPTVREFDGLALSSRNRYLDESQRDCSGGACRLLWSPVRTRRAGGAEAILATARAFWQLFRRSRSTTSRCGASICGPAPERGDGRLLVAAKLGTTRLIDNVGVAVGTGFLERDTDPSADAIDDLLSH